MVYDLRSHQYVSTDGPLLGEYPAANPANQWIGVDALEPLAWSRATGIVRLPLPNLARPITLMEPSYISDDGRIIAGNAQDSHGVTSPVLWTCR